MSRFLGPQPRWVVHPILFGTAYVLNTALHNEISPAGFVRPLVVVIAAAASLMGLGRLLRGNRWDGALLATLVIAFIVSPVPLAWLWFQAREALGVWLGTIVIAALLIGSLSVMGVHVLRQKHRRQPVRRPSTETLQILSVALVVAVIGSSLLAHPPALAPRTPSPASSTVSSETPDIIVILLDGYPRTDVLERRLGTSDQPFLNRLRERGFDVGSTSWSNYMHTSLTLASMFQMRYIDQIPTLKPLIGSGQRELGALRDAAEDGAAFTTLREAGYEIILSTPGWEHVTFRDAADRLLDSGELSDLEVSLLHETWLLYLANAVWPNIFTDSLRDRIVHGFDALDRFATQQRARPAFLLLHVPAPHLPLVVGPDGEAARLPALMYAKSDRKALQMTDQEYGEAWAAELAYIDGRVVASVDLLLRSEAGRNAVVVVMADHGYSFEVRADDPEARLANLFAARTPGASGLLAGPTSPVNLLRILFSRYLGADLPILANRHFVSDWTTPLRLTEFEPSTVR